MPAKFVLKKGSSGKFRFNLLATNGQVIATSEAYESKAAAMRGIQSVQKNASGAQVDDQTGGTGSAGASKTAAKKTSASKTAAKKTSAGKTAAKKTSAKKTSAKKTTAKKAGARRTSARRSASGSDAGDGGAERMSPNPQDDSAQQDGAEHVYDTVELQLGTCHYGGLEEEATLMATREDGTGWIAVCEEHRQQAEQDGFVVNEDA